MNVNAFMATLMELITSAIENFIKLVASVPPATINKPGILRKMTALPPRMIAERTNTVPPARPMIVAISILS